MTVFVSNWYLERAYLSYLGTPGGYTLDKERIHDIRARHDSICPGSVTCYLALSVDKRGVGVYTCVAL